MAEELRETLSINWVVILINDLIKFADKQQMERWKGPDCRSFGPHGVGVLWAHGYVH
jgi:hypothetical protein